MSAVFFFCAFAGLFFCAFAGLFFCAAGQTSNSSRLRVVTIAADPFIVAGSDGHLTGFIVDLLNLVAPLAGFEYNITLQPDGAYGGLQPDGKWSGLVGSLVDGIADIAAADLSITSSRDAVIDYATPYGQTHTKILENAASGTNKVHYLAIKGFATVDVLKRATDPGVKAMWDDIQANNGMVNNIQEGVDKVASGGYALISAKFSLKQVKSGSAVIRFGDKILASTYTAFAVPQGSPLRDRISIAVSKINESGQLQTLISRYGL